MTLFEFWNYLFNIFLFVLQSSPLLESGDSVDNFLLRREVTQMPMVASEIFLPQLDQVDSNSHDSLLDDDSSATTLCTNNTSSKLATSRSLSLPQFSMNCGDTVSHTANYVDQPDHTITRDGSFTVSSKRILCIVGKW